MSNNEIWDTQSALPPPPPPPPPAKPVGKGRMVLVGVGGLMLGLLLASAGGSSTPETITATAPTVTKTVTQQGAVVTETVPADAPTKTVVVTEQPAAPETAFGPGSWLVGEDIAAGQYKTAEQVGEGCYWEITAGPNGQDIVANEFVGQSGGIERVTLRKGQQFSSNDCGDWVKAK